jgi:N-acetylated-alpha-linked acidic dipeptidase
VGERARARLAVDAAAPGASEEAKAKGLAVADPAKDMPIEAVGSGSDYSSFIDHLGLAVLDVGYGGEGEAGGVYHSLYDDYEHHSRFVDPGFAYDAALAKTVGRMVLRLADADLPQQRYGDFADSVARYVDEVKRLAASKAQETSIQARLLSAGAYGLAADPTQPGAAPDPFPAAVSVDFARLDAGLAKLKASASAFDAALAAKGAGLGPTQRTRLDAALQPLEQSLLLPQGLPGRPWYQNLIYAPGRFTGYGAKTLPGVREALEERRYKDAQTYVGLTGQALGAYAAGLDRATAILNGR